MLQVTTTFANLMTKKRNRHSEACVFCRRRKVKCDREKPCGTCIKFGNDDCVYETRGIKPHLKMEKDREAIQNEIRLLETKLNNLRRDLGFNEPQSSTDAISSSTLDFVESYRTGNKSLPHDFPFQELIGNNPVAKHDDRIYLTQKQTITERKLWSYETAFNWVSLIRLDSVGRGMVNFFTNKATNIDFLSSTISEGLNSIETQIMEDQLHSNVASTAELMEKIVAFLPCKKATAKLIAIFFSTVYPVYPILDQRKFRSAIDSIIAYDEAGIVKEVVCKTKIDLANVSTLLIMARLSYLSLILVGHPPKRGQNALSEFSINPVSAEVITIAKKCFNLIDGVRSIEVLQSALMYRIYVKLAPEEGDCDKGSKVAQHNSYITSLAISMGIHRDPNTIYSQPLQPWEANLNRKLWWVIYGINLHHSVHEGDRFIWTTADYDTRRPSFTEGALNIENFELEEASVSAINSCINSRKVLEEVLNVSIHARKPADMFQVALLLSHVETHIIKHYGEVHKKVSNELNEVKKVQASRVHLDSTSVVLSMLFYFINYYENKKNSTLVAFYVKKIVVIITYDLIPLSDALFSSRHNDMTYLVVFPDLIDIIQKACLFLFTFFVRSTKDEVKLNNDTEYFTVLKDTTNLFKMSTKLLLDTLVDLSVRYFTAFRLSKVLAIAFDAAQGPDFYGDEVVKQAPGFEFESKNLKDINIILHATLSRLRDLRRHLASEGVKIPQLPADSPSADTTDPEVEKILQELLATRLETQVKDVSIANYTNVGFDGSPKLDDSTHVFENFFETHK